MWLAVISLVVFGLGWATPSLADQRDPRLDELFEKLRVGTDDSEAVADEIQEIWLIAPETGINILAARLTAAIDLGDAQTAAVLADHVTSLAPHYGEGWMLAGYAARLREDSNAARAAFTRALALEPRHFNAHIALGNLANAEGDTRAAFDHYEKALSLHPGLEDIRELANRLRAAIGSQEI